MDFGTPSDEFECSWNLTHCVLCSDYYTGDHYLVRLKPRCAGIRILTLDGGGIRGIIELAILKHLGRILGLGIPIREYFDLIIGTSTGTYLCPISYFSLY